MQTIDIEQTGLIPRRELRFLLHEWLDVGGLAEAGRFSGQDQGDYDEVVEMASRMANDLFAPSLRLVDEQPPHGLHHGTIALPEETRIAIQAFAEAGLFGMSLPVDVGGMALPQTVTMAAYICFQAANSSVAAYPYMTIAAADLILAEGSDEQAARFVPAMTEGRSFGTMCLSEPQAGSSLADVKARAVEQDDGSYRIFGTKTWITAGDHEIGENILHMVLARLPGSPDGVRGISLFIVPKRVVDENGNPGDRNDVVLAGLNHKMGTRGTVNAVLNFGEGAFTPGGEAGAIGYMVGKPDTGLSSMFHMMNEARIGVGLTAASIGYAGYRKSVSYAHQRAQGRPLVDRDDSAPQVPIIEHTDVRRMLLAQKAYTEGGLALGMYASRLLDGISVSDDDEERMQLKLLLDVLTPIVKSWPSQWCLEANSLAIQVHGGAGYTTDVDVELHYRDNRLNAIHEGTHGIQALDLLGRKVTMNGGAGLAALITEIQKTIGRARSLSGEAAGFADSLDQACQSLAEVTAALWADLDVPVALANSSIYLEAAGHIVVAWLWLDQFLATEGAEDDFYEGKRQAARYFFIHELPKTGPQLKLLASLDRTALDTRAEWL